MAKLIVLTAFVLGFAAFLAIRFLAHHAKAGIREARKAAAAVNVGALSTAIDSDGIDYSVDPERGANN